MNSSITIRFAVETDVPIILTMIKELAEYEQLSHEVVATEQLLQHFLFERQSAEVLIAYDQQEPVGFALFFHNFSTFLGRHGIYLEDLFVRPTARNKGVGIKLLASLAKLAEERECGRIEWSVLDWNQLAIDFYLKLGAVPMKDWTVFRLQQSEIAELAKKS